MAKNQFKLNSFIDKIERDLAKAEKDKLRKAANLFKRRLRAKIKALGLVDDGDLLKGVDSITMEHASLIGIGAPGFHALILEYGTEERFTLGNGEKRKGIRGTGKVEPTNFFLKTMQESAADIQKILNEEWL
ncbi:MAG: HK97 gp10 family phage protein [Candidatus Hodarchaeales archaeon]